MPSFVKKANFTAGEISPKMRGRHDYEKYDNAVLTMLNCYAFPQGGTTRRPGTRFILETKDSTKTSRLVRFEFSTTQAYVLEFGNLYMRVFMDQGVVLDGASPYELVTPYATADISELSFAQSADQLFVFHNDYAPRVISRTDHDAWSITEMAFTDGPWEAINTTEITLKPSQAAATVFTITSITNAKPPVVTTSAAAGFSEGDTVYIYGVIGMTELNGNTYKVEDIGGGGGNDFELYNPTEVDSGNTDGIGAIPSILNDSGQNFTTTVAIGDLVHNTTDDTYAHVTGVTSDTRLALDADIMDDGEDYHIHRPVDGTAMGTYSAQSGFVYSYSAATPTITASAATFASTDVGRLVTIGEASGDDTVWGIAKITAFNSTTNVDVQILTGFNSTNALDTWKLGTWCATLGYPGLCTFFENRLIGARSDTYPQSIWFSKIDNYYDFGVSDPVVDTDGLSTKLVANNVNVIKWLSVAKVLFVGTTGGEWVLEGAADTGITPSSLRQKRESTYGCTDVPPMHIDDATIYVQRPGKKIREFLYSLETDSFISPDISILAEHLFKDYAISEWAFAKEPAQFVWCIRSDGVLVGITYNRLQKVVAFHRHTTDGTFESVCTVPGDDRDEVWLIVNRTIDGSTVRYVEMFEAEYSAGSDTNAENARYLDCMLTYDSTATSSISGLTHLEGESVTILADGKVHPAKTVSSGAVTLNYSASVVHAGLNYNSDLELMPYENEDKRGSTIGKTKRISKVALLLLESVGCKIGPDSSNLVYLPFNEGQSYTSGTELFTGEKIHDFDGDDDYQVQVFIRQDQPLPLTILVVSAEVNYNP